MTAMGAHRSTTTPGSTDHRLRTAATTTPTSRQPAAQTATGAGTRTSMTRAAAAPSQPGELSVAPMTRPPASCPGRVRTNTTQDASRASPHPRARPAHVVRPTRQPPATCSSLRPAAGAPLRAGPGVPAASWALPVPSRSACPGPSWPWEPGWPGKSGWSWEPGWPGKPWLWEPDRLSKPGRPGRSGAPASAAPTASAAPVAPSVSCGTTLSTPPGRPARRGWYGPGWPGPGAGTSCRCSTDPGAPSPPRTGWSAPRPATGP